VKQKKQKENDARIFFNLSYYFGSMDMKASKQASISMLQLWD